MLSLDGGYITYLGQNVTSPAKSISVPSGKDVKFSVSPDEGMAVRSVSVTSGAGTSDLSADADGNYVIEASLVKDDITLSVTCSAEQAASAAVTAAAVTIQSDAASVPSVAGTVTFKSNGGSVDAPASKDVASIGDEVVLPDYSGTNGKLKFVGWSENSNATGYGQYRSAIYHVGDTFKVTGSTTLYAQWAVSNADAKFFVRLDGSIPTEPQWHPQAGYTGGISISGAVSSSDFYTNSSDGVGSHLLASPSDEQIAAMCKRCGLSYDPSTQYVLWYVIKQEADLHVDGVLLNKNKVNLSYVPNAPSGTWSNMPDGKQFSVGDDTSVSGKTPVRNGYQFLGWNTEANGSGASYASGQSIKMNESLTLYAQWKPNDRTAYTVRWVDESDGHAIKTEPRYAKTDETVSATQGDRSLDGYTYLGDDDASAVTSGVVTSDGKLELVLPFKSDSDVSYVVNYYEDGTETKVHESKTVDGRKLGDTVSEDAVDVTGYTKVNPTSKSITLGADGNVINFYYKALHVTLNFRDVSDGSLIASKDGSYGDTFEAGAERDINLEAAKTFAKNGSHDGIKTEDIDAAKSVSDLNKLGFTFAFDGWCTGSHDGGTMVVSGTDMGSLGVTYENTDSISMFSGSTADVYAQLTYCLVLFCVSWCFNRA